MNTNLVREDWRDSRFAGFIFLQFGSHRFRPQAADKIDEVPDVLFFLDLGFEGRHSISRPIPDAAKDFTLGCPALPELRLRKVGRICHYVHHRLAVSAVARGATARIE